MYIQYCNIQCVRPARQTQHKQAFNSHAGFCLAKCDFLFWERGQQEFFKHLNSNYSNGSIYSAFSNFFGQTDTLLCGHFKLFHGPKIILASYSLTDPIELNLGWAWFSFMFPIYFHYICSLAGSYIHKMTSVTQVLPSCSCLKSFAKLFL